METITETTVKTITAGAIVFDRFPGAAPKWRALESVEPCPEALDYGWYLLKMSGRRKAIMAPGNRSLVVKTDR